ncbi:hypothetical protein [uncultured Pontibacter sp.]|uniref:hypothetical protein n=1 Tax=uncultured Pontibacter sp. TaxID=453356 RepID=UPI002626E3FE|nr:hypothetical protein [uncultured Pontibacter sp.]
MPELDPDDLPDVEPDDLPEVVLEDLPLADLEELAFVVEDLEPEPDDLPLFEDEEPLSDPEDEVRPLLELPIDVLDDDEGLLDDPLDILDDSFELWFFSVSFIVLISLFIVKIKFVACPAHLSHRGGRCGFCYPQNRHKILVTVPLF